MDYEIEFTVKLPQRNNFDSDSLDYFSKLSENANRGAYFNSQSEDDSNEELQ